MRLQGLLLSVGWPTVSPQCMYMLWAAPNPQVANGLFMIKSWFDDALVSIFLASVILFFSLLLVICLRNSLIPNWKYSHSVHHTAILAMSFLVHLTDMFYHIESGPWRSLEKWSRPRGERGLFSKRLCLEHRRLESGVGMSVHFTQVSAEDGGWLTACGYFLETEFKVEWKEHKSFASM